MLGDDSATHIEFFFKRDEYFVFRDGIREDVIYACGRVFSRVGHDTIADVPEFFCRYAVPIVLRETLYCFSLLLQKPFDEARVPFKFAP